MGGGFDVNGLLNELQNDRSGLGRGGGGFDVDAILSKEGKAKGKDFVGDIAKQLGLDKDDEKKNKQFLDELLNEKDKGKDKKGQDEVIEFVKFNQTAVQNDIKNATATSAEILYTVRYLETSNRQIANSYPRPPRA